jgi:hypothetical protein
MEFALESEMRRPVIKWMNRMGFFVAVEFWLVNQQSDLICARYGNRPAPRRRPPLREIVAIELKLNSVGEVIEQAAKNLKAADLSWAAMPATRIGKMRQSTTKRFQAAGVGLLSVTPSEVEQVILPSIAGPGRRSRADQLWRRVGKYYTEFERFGTFNAQHTPKPRS